MVLESKPNVDEVYERWVRLGDAERRGRLAVEVRKPDGVYTYTAAGAILGEVDTRIDAKTAKQIITQLATTASQT